MCQLGKYRAEIITIESLTCFVLAGCFVCGSNHFNQSMKFSLCKQKHMDFIQNRQCCSAMATIVRTGVKTWTQDVMKIVVKMWSLGISLSMILPLPVPCP